MVSGAATIEPVPSGGMDAKRQATGPAHELIEEMWELIHRGPMLGLVSREASRSRTMTFFPGPTPTSTTTRPGATEDRTRPCSRCTSRSTGKLPGGIPAAGQAESAIRIPFKPAGTTLTGKRPAGHPQQPKKRLNFGAISLDT